jgi:hypothetical protein
MSKASIGSRLPSVTTVFPDLISKNSRKSSGVLTSDGQLPISLDSLPEDMFSYIDEENGTVVQTPTILSEAVQFNRPGAVLNGSATCDAFIDYIEHGRNDRSGNFHSSTTDLNNWECPFSGTVQGGRIHVTLHILWKLPDGATRGDTHQMEGSVAGLTRRHQ